MLYLVCRLAGVVHFHPTCNEHPLYGAHSGIELLKFNIQDIDTEWHYSFCPFISLLSVLLLTVPNSAAQDFCTLLFTICCKRKKKETASQYCNNRVLLEGIPFQSAYSLSKHVSYKSSISPYYSKGLMFCLSFA